MGFGYSSPGGSDFERKMRAEIIAAANLMSVGATDFSNFKNSRCNPKYWNRTASGGFELKQGVRPSAAVTDIFVNGQLYAFECAMAMVMILYKATIASIGAEAFDRYFTDLFLWDWNYDSNLQMITTFNKFEMQPGDVVYFKNPDHDPELPEWQGRTLLCWAGTATTGTGLASKVRKK